jgi:hypothetical protein
MAVSPSGYPHGPNAGLEIRPLTRLTTKFKAATDSL